MTPLEQELARLTRTRDQLTQRIRDTQRRLHAEQAHRARQARRASHGTDSGYYAHLRGSNGWTRPACGPCTRAHADATQARAGRQEAS